MATATLPSRIISRTDLARSTREILESVSRGQPAVVESYGHEQAVILDLLDYRLLCALAGRRLDRPADGESSSVEAVLERYLLSQISLGKAAELLGRSRFELAERFQRLGVSLHMGPATLEEAESEVRNALGYSTTP